MPFMTVVLAELHLRVDRLVPKSCEARARFVLRGPATPLTPMAICLAMSSGFNSANRVQQIGANRCVGAKAQDGHVRQN
eukprot:3946626-Amphidinium_carterae.1